MVRPPQLYSEKLRAAIDMAAGPRDVIQWLPAWVTDAEGGRRRYWGLHFPEPPEAIIDTKLSVYGGAPGVVMKGVLDLAKLDGRHVTVSPEGGGGFDFLVSARARDVIRAAGCEGLVFARFPPGRIAGLGGRCSASG